MATRLQVIVLSVALCVGATAAHATTDPLIEGARLCTQRFPIEEKGQNIPTHLLAAIATTESGRYHQGLGMSVPWPWTINVEGKGYYFDSKAEAIAQTRNLLAQGKQSIDVGCMQVNLKHHPKAFANLDQAFDPATNVAYSAKFLRENYATLGDWIKATAAYHSRTPIHGARYLGEIERSWNRIVAKVAAAREGKGGDVVVASRSKNPLTQTKTRIVDSGRPMAAATKARVIQVSDAGTTRRSSSVMVVSAKEPQALQSVHVVKVADATPVAAPVAVSTPPAPETLPVGNSVRRVNLDNRTDAGVASSGPQFVFSN